MTGCTLTEVRKGSYLDSVALMRLSREVAAMDGVVEAALMMGSPSNMAIMLAAGLVEGELGARSNDLVLAVKGVSEEAARAAMRSALTKLDRPRTAAGNSDTWRPRTLAAALRDMPDANLALISVPGEFAAAEARKALRRGLNVMMFSDNVSLEDELSLKQEARERGLLMMGPDCGTAVINGAPLAFANRVNRGAISIIGASGTGTQEVSCLISEAGQGVAHAIGVGGRDLKQEIGGITTLQAMDALDEDAATESVVLISKPPHPEVAKKIVARIGQSPKPYTVCFIGAERYELPANARQAATLREAAQLAIGGGGIGNDFDSAQLHMVMKLGGRSGGRIEGLFCGGTLCAEAQVVLSAGGRRVVSNAPIPGSAAVKTQALRGADRIIDLGSDEYTQGRPHPMIDPSIRDELFLSALEDDGVAVVLVDLVIGFGAHADPAGHLARLLPSGRAGRPPVIASVTGTERDPQCRSEQVARLRSAGIVVAPSNAKASELALAVAAAG